MLQVPFYKRVLSYLYPIKLRQSSSPENPVLELLLYQDQFQLATEDAIYSDGRRYRPIVAAFKHLKTFLPQLRRVLQLGTGIGSSVQIAGKMGFYPEFTLVERDAAVLGLAAEVLGPSGETFQYQPVCADAEVFVDTDQAKYDLVIVDVFSGRVVPSFLYDPVFLDKCLRRLNNEGKLVMNYIINNEAEWVNMQDAFKQVAPTHQVISFDVNRVFIATV